MSRENFGQGAAKVKEPTVVLFANTDRYLSNSAAR
jgi:hypothetical protein